MIKILELDITLKDSKPKIWRRVLVPDHLNFYELHYVIQFAMGWTNSHLHQFVVGRHDRCISVPFDGDFGEEAEDGKKVLINKILKAPKDKIKYEYDFGDGWEHLVEVKKVHEPQVGMYYPVVIDGAMACPPEDCGGIWGYAALVETMKNKKSDRYEEMLEWLGEDFDPEEFDKEDINDEYFKNFKEIVEEWDDIAFS
jgi:Plasmid pRiA4b ORF-3-like protein